MYGSVRWIRPGCIACLMFIVTIAWGSLHAIALSSWQSLPTDTEIQQAAQAFVSSIPNRSVHDWKTFKYHDPDNADPVYSNGVGLAFRVPNPDYEPGNADQPDLECATTWLEWSFEYGWGFVGSSRLMCFSSTDTLDALIQRFLSWDRIDAGWVGGGENRPPTVKLTYSPLYPTTQDTVEFFAAASDPDGDSLTYTWYLNGSQQAATQSSAQWSKPDTGTHTIQVVVSDGKGGSAQDSVEFVVEAEQKRYVIMPGIGDLEGEKPIAFVTKIEMDGKVTSEPNTPLYRGGFVKTGRGVVIVVTWRTTAFVILEEYTYFEVKTEKLASADTTVIYSNLIQGILRFYGPPKREAEAKQKFEIETEMAVVGIKGTELTIEHTAGVTTVAVTEGEVEVKDKATGGVKTIRAGETDRFDGTSTPPPPPREMLIFDNNNVGAIANTPTRPTEFTITETYEITLIKNYHWNNGRGAGPGTISLRDSNGKTLGTWTARGNVGMGGVPNAYWSVQPNIVLGPGTYAVMDSDPSTWAHNSESNNQGFSIIRGVQVAYSEGGVEMALDSNANGVLDDSEITKAIQVWILGQDVPGTAVKIDDGKIKDLVQMWILGTPIGGLPLAAPRSKLQLELSTPSPLMRIVGLTDPEVQDLQVRVFDLSGRLLLHEQTASSILRFALRTGTGQPLANGVYLYVVTARREDGSLWRSEVRKLLVLR